MTTNAEPSRRGVARRMPWWVIAALLLVLVVVAATAWWMHSRRAADDRAATQAKLDASLARQQSLAAALRALDSAAEPECLPGQVRVPAPAGAAASATTAAAPQTAVPRAGAAAESPVGEPTAVAASGAPAALLTQQALVDRLERATVLVLLPLRDGVALGSGFFVSPQHLVTNRHVVEGSRDGRVLLVSRSLRKVRHGTVVGLTKVAPGVPDLAVVRLDDGQAPGTLAVGAPAAKLSEVVAAGYPGLVVKGDAGFARLMRDGDVSAAPDLSLTRGTIQSLQDFSGGTAVIVHTASILQGNSGGPLVDACGRVVGVNTFITVDAKQSAKVSYAIESRLIERFAQSVGVRLTIDPSRCG